MDICAELKTIKDTLAEQGLLLEETRTQMRMAALAKIETDDQAARKHDRLLERVDELTTLVKGLVGDAKLLKRVVGAYIVHSDGNTVAVAVAGAENISIMSDVEITVNNHNEPSLLIDKFTIPELISHIENLSPTLAEVMG